VTLFLLILSSSLAQDTGTTPVAGMHIVENVRGNTNAVIGGQNLAIVLWCQPNGDNELAKKITSVSPAFEADSKAFESSLMPRSDITTLVMMNNPTASEVTDWLKVQAGNLDGEAYRQVIVSVACPAVGGDMDEERLLTREVTDPNTGGLTFADLATGVSAIANTTVWILDASRDLSGATGSPTFGPTADDVAKLGIKDAFAISSSASGKYGNAGLLTAASAVIARTNGGTIDLATLYYSGIKPMASALELGTSLGTPGDGWTNNQQRIILPGGPIIVSVADVTPPMKRKKVPTGCWVAGGGVLSLVAGSVFAIEAASHYDTLEQYNVVGGASAGSASSRPPAGSPGRYSTRTKRPSRWFPREPA
jgi:hypothetical protein